MNLPKFEKEGPDAAHAVVEQHQAYFDGAFVSANIYDRNKLRAGNQRARTGHRRPDGATTVIHPNHTGEVDEYLSILIKPDKAH